MSWSNDKYVYSMSEIHLEWNVIILFMTYTGFNPPPLHSNVYLVKGQGLVGLWSAWDTTG